MMFNRNVYFAFWMLSFFTLLSPVVVASDWIDLNNDLFDAVEEYKSSHTPSGTLEQLSAELCKIHERAVNSNNIFEIMSYYDQFNPEPDIKLDLMLTDLWFDALSSWSIASYTLIYNLWLIDDDWAKTHQESAPFYINDDELPEDKAYFLVNYCHDLDSFWKSSKENFNILSFRLLDENNPISKYVVWLKNALSANEKAIKIWGEGSEDVESYSQDAAKLAILEYQGKLQDDFPDVWLNVIMEYADFQREVSKIQQKLESLLEFYSQQSSSEVEALEYMRRLKNAQLSEYKNHDAEIRFYLFSLPVRFYDLYRFFQYKAADNFLFDDKKLMRHSAIQVSKLTSFIPFLNEDVTKGLMETQRLLKDQYSEKEYQDIVTESRLIPNNWTSTLERLSLP